MIKAFPAHATVPTCDPIVVADPATVLEALQSDAVIVGSVSSTPLTQIKYAPKEGTFKMFCAVDVIAMG